MLFQFHKGTIKTRGGAHRRQLRPHFNSIKVQLKLSSGISSQSDKRFQFHKGTIKTFANCLRESTNYHFNSIKVQLKQIPRNVRRVRL